MQILTLDSHSLDNYQRCPKLYSYTTLQNIEPISLYAPFEKGTVISRCLEDYYKKPEITGSIMKEICERNIYNNNPLNEETRLHIQMRFLKYTQHYKNEQWKVVAVEKGFSSLLYEDENVKFIYEGRPDLIVSLQDNRMGIVDHKSQSRADNLYFNNNQALGYCWATGIRIFTYNYFGLQETGGPKDWFRRSSIIFEDKQIKDWEKSTIHWYFRLMHDENFQKSYQCTGKYGVCGYHDLCEETNNLIRIDKIKREFKQREHKAW